MVEISCATWRGLVFPAPPQTADGVGEEGKGSWVQAQLVKCAIFWCHWWGRWLVLAQPQSIHSSLAFSDRVDNIKMFLSNLKISGNWTLFAFPGLPCDWVGNIGFCGSVKQKIRSSPDSGGFRAAVEGGQLWLGCSSPCSGSWWPEWQGGEDTVQTNKDSTH